MENKIKLAVNGTLMSGLALNDNLLKAGGVFVEETTTAPYYRLWSVQDDYPGMLRDNQFGTSVQVEIWSLFVEGLMDVLEHEPPGLTLGRVELTSGEVVFGILAEPYLIEGCTEITLWGGWRAYLHQK